MPLPAPIAKQSPETEDVAVELYTDERVAEFLLNNAVTAAEYRQARREVAEEFGLDPDAIPHAPILNDDGDA